MENRYYTKLEIMKAKARLIEDDRERALFIRNYPDILATDKAGYAILLLPFVILREPYLFICRELVKLYPQEFQNNGIRNREELEKKVEETVKTSDCWFG